MGETTTTLRRTWEGAAPGWAKWEEVFSRTLADATDQMLDAAGVTEGMRVLDLACGTGSQTLRAARRVGNAGEVVASDISATMLQHVRRNAAAADLDNITTVEGAAEELELPERVDAAISRMGLMLFASPSRAVAAVRDALKPDARFAALVFTAPTSNPFLAAPMPILLRHAGAPPPAPGQPGVFALGGDGALARLLTDAGLTNVQTSIVRAKLRLPSADDAVTLLQEAAGAYQAIVANLSQADRASAWTEVRNSLAPFETSNGFETDLELLLGSGTRPTEH